MLTNSRDGKFWFLAIFSSRPRPESALVRRASADYGGCLGVIALLCYAFARHLTAPLRKMQKTIERFGHGDFSARVNIRRGDELGQLARTSDQMAERIENLLKAQRRLLQDISHELRSPSCSPRCSRRIGKRRRESGYIAESDREGSRTAEHIWSANSSRSPEPKVIRPALPPSRCVSTNWSSASLTMSTIEADRRQVKLHCTLEEIELPRQSGVVAPRLRKCDPQRHSLLTGRRR